MKFILVLFIYLISFSQEKTNFLEHLQNKVSQKQLNEKEALIESIKYMFKEYDGKYLPIKNGTQLISAYKNIRHELSANIKNEIDAYLFKKSNKNSLLYTSPSGLFQLNYEISGSDSVITESLDGDAIPDYVQNAALYLDYSHDFLVNQKSYKNPLINNRKYLVYFESMSAYGYNYESDDGLTTEIVLNSTFNGFSSNSDPEGNVKGALKVTVAHEYKHSIQFATDKNLYNDFSDFWVELDATWAEEFVYPQVNDYFNYLGNSSSQISYPYVTMNNHGNTGSYYDVIWQLYLSQAFGESFMLDLWKRRENNSGESFLISYQKIVEKNSETMSNAIREYSVWNYIVSNRYNGNIGYEDASDFPIAKFPQILDYTSNFSTSVSSFASRQVLLNSTENQFLNLEISAHNDLSFAIVYTNNLSQTVVDYVNSSLDTFKYHFQNKMIDISEAALIVVNSNTSSGSRSFSIESFWTNTPGQNEQVNKIELVTNPILNNQLIISHPVENHQSINSVSLYNILGKRISQHKLRNLSDQTVIPFTNSLASGVYFAHIIYGTHKKTIKFIFVK